MMIPTVTVGISPVGISREVIMGEVDPSMSSIGKPSSVDSMITERVLPVPTKHVRHLANLSGLLWLNDRMLFSVNPHETLVWEPPWDRPTHRIGCSGVASFRARDVERCGIVGATSEVHLIDHTTNFDHLALRPPPNLRIGDPRTPPQHFCGGALSPDGNLLVTAATAPRRSLLTLRIDAHTYTVVDCDARIVDLMILADSQYALLDDGSVVVYSPTWIPMRQYWPSLRAQRPVRFLPSEFPEDDVLAVYSSGHVIAYPSAHVHVHALLVHDRVRSADRAGRKIVMGTDAHVLVFALDNDALASCVWNRQCFPHAGHLVAVSPSGRFLAVAPIGDVNTGVIRDHAGMAFASLEAKCASEMLSVEQRYGIRLIDFGGPNFGRTPQPHSDASDLDWDPFPADA